MSISLFINDFATLSQAKLVTPGLEYSCSLKLHKQGYFSISLASLTLTSFFNQLL